jgi:integrase
MPFALVAPRPGKTPYWYVRGTYLGRHVNRSTGARERRLAAKVLRQWQSEIERGRFFEPGAPTFASAALAYMKAGGERTFLTPIIEHFATTPLPLIDQAAIDAASEALYPDRSAATRNRQLYTPVSAVLRRAGVVLALRRPKGHAGTKATGWLWPEQFDALYEAAGTLDREFQLLLLTLCYTGMRLTEMLTLRTDHVRLDEGFAYLAKTKTQEPRPIFLPPFLAEALRAHPRGFAQRPGETVFRFHKGGHIYSLLFAAAAKAGVELPPRSAFHILCHTYATWMRRFGGLDTKGLVATGRWKDRKSADRYEHVVVSEEARRATLLPLPKALRA